MINGLFKLIFLVVILGVLAAIIVPRAYTPKATPNDVPSQVVMKQEALSKQQAPDPAIVADLLRRQKAEEAAENRRIQAATKGLVVIYDKVQEVRWYGTTEWKQGWAGVFLYIGKEANVPPWLKLIFRNHDDRWVFAKKVLIKADESLFTMVPTKWKRYNDSSVYEEADFVVEKLEHSIIMKMVNARSLILRFEGDDRYRDLNVSASMKRNLQKILDAYTAMGGLIQ